MSNLDLIADLERSIGASQVKFDYLTRLLYSTDASNYQIMPLGVTFPRHVEDVIAIHELANRFQVPILPRGGGSSLAGQTVGAAIIMDMSRHFRRVRGINAEEKTVRVEAGVILGSLNKQLTSLNLMFGPDPASAERAVIGGVVGNNSTGAHSILYGMTADHIARLEVVLANGEHVWLDENHPTLNAIRAKISAIVRANQAEIAARYPQTFRTVAGYALNKIDPDDVNLNWLLAGSEGTLATILSAELNLVERPPQKRLALVHFETLRAALEATPRILEVNPSAIELSDRFLHQKTREHMDYRHRLTFLEGDPAAVLAVEFYGENEAELTAKIETLKAHLQRIGHRGSITYAVTPTEQANVWAVRKAGLGLLLSQRGDEKPIAFVEDAAVPVENLADYISEVEDLIHRNGTSYAIYAHASAGCLHVRPLVNLKSIKGREQYRAIAEGVAKTVLKYAGTITGEHGQGLARGEFIEALFGSQLYGAFQAVKGAFDPQNRLNPDKIINVPPMDDPAILRYNTEYHILDLPTRYSWIADGNFAGGIEMCNGAGVCRKEDTGTMCPSYMATLDEAHSTRGRANTLRAAISGQLPDGLGSEAAHGVFDLCLACKACKAECPSSVDVARMKSEFLALYQDVHGIDLKTRLFANIHRLNRWGSFAPTLANFLLTNPLGLTGAKMLGLPTERPLPRLAKRRFSTVGAVLMNSRPPAPTLIIDTFTEYNHPEIGEAVLKIAESLDVPLNIMRLPEQGCCGRPAISKGLLDLAKEMANANIGRLSALPHLAPFLFIEPSCQSAFVDDYPALVDESLREQAETVAAKCHSVETWLLEQILQHGDKLQWDETPREILLHGHCHQKALWGTSATKALLAQIPNSSVSEIDSGCCGVAGSFGYEHYDLSLKIANQRLLPAIQAQPNALVAAVGTSCRAQIQDAGYQVQHPAEIIAQALAN